jgi:hypothetical protein
MNPIEFLFSFFGETIKRLFTSTPQVPRIISYVGFVLSLVSVVLLQVQSAYFLPDGLHFLANQITPYVTFAIGIFSRLATYGDVKPSAESQK